MSFTTVKKGSKGEIVKALQYILGLNPDGIFGKNTEAAVKTLQNQLGLSADGKAGTLTFQAIANKAPTLKIGSKNEYVYALEALLDTMTLDGEYKQDEYEHVRTYQAAKNLDIDGVVGQKTWMALFGIDNISSSSGANIEIQTGNGVNTKQPVNYKQYDSRWGSKIYTKNNTYDKSQTIKNSGCGPTSMADIIATWFDKNITPVEMCALSVANGYRTNNSGTSWGFFKFVATKYPFSKFVQTSSFVTLQACLAAGGLAVVSFRPSKWTKGGCIEMAS